MVLSSHKWNRSKSVGSKKFFFKPYPQRWCRAPARSLTLCTLE
jgi:hypothetical protein